MQSLIQMQDLQLNNKRVLVREDFNVPIQNGVVLNDERLKAALPTLRFLIEQNARIMLLSHLGRPKEGSYSEEFSLKPVAERLSQLLHQPVRLEADWLKGINVAPKEIVLCENVRFNKGEKANDEALAKQMAALCDVFIMDAFATAHRAEASTVGITKYASSVAAGPLLSAELDALSRVLLHPKKPIVAIVGGAKISSKLQILESLLDQVDTLIVGGGIANHFIALKHAIGQSLFEPEYATVAKALLEKAEALKVNIVIPVDGIVSKELSDTAETRMTDLSDILPDEKILDIGPKTGEHYAKLFKAAGTILWNGPVGAFEWSPFGEGTKHCAKAIASSAAFSIAGGGETLAAIAKYGVYDHISYVSTGGGAFLAYLERKTLPAVAALAERANQKL
jgi:phosphoglycerate kinase